MLFCLCFSFSDAFTRGFCAYPEYGKIYRAGERIRFNEVSFQFGGDFDKNNYQYVIPQTGVYYFSFSIYSSQIRYPRPARSSAELMINGKSVIDALAYNSNRKYIVVHSSQFILHYCKQGSVVYMRSRYSDNKVWGYKRTNLCGFCINC